MDGTLNLVNHLCVPVPRCAHASVHASFDWVERSEQVRGVSHSPGRTPPLSLAAFANVSTAR